MVHGEVIHDGQGQDGDPHRDDLHRDDPLHHDDHVAAYLGSDKLVIKENYAN